MKHRTSVPIAHWLRLVGLILGCGACVTIAAGCSKPPAPVEATTTSEPPRGDGSGARPIGSETPPGGPPGTPGTGR